MSRVAWRGFVRVTRPRIVSPTDGTSDWVRGLVDDELDEDVRISRDVGDLAEVAVLVVPSFPARLAWAVDLFKRCMPTPIDCAGFKVMVSPGTTTSVVDMAIVSWQKSRLTVGNDENDKVVLMELSDR